MRLPGMPSLLFLAYLLVLLPAMVFRRSRVLNATGAGAVRKPLSREAIWRGMLLSQGLLLALSWWVGHGFDYDLFELGPLGVREILLAFGALAACLGLRSIVRRLRPEQERRGLIVYFLAPRSPMEWALWISTVCGAAVAEEAAYRGVCMAILWYCLGDPWLAALICALGFSIAHWVQGWKSASVIFVMGLILQGLVALTGTLVLAMLVHAAYNFLAGYRIAREAD